MEPHRMKMDQEQSQCQMNSKYNQPLSAGNWNQIPKKIIQGIWKKRVSGIMKTAVTVKAVEYKRRKTCKWSQRWWVGNLWLYTKTPLKVYFPVWGYFPMWGYFPILHGVLYLEWDINRCPRWNWLKVQEMLHYRTTVSRLKGRKCRTFQSRARLVKGHKIGKWRKRRSYDLRVTVGKCLRTSPAKSTNGQSCRAFWEPAFRAEK